MKFRIRRKFQTLQQKKTCPKRNIKEQKSGLQRGFVINMSLEFLAGFAKKKNLKGGGDLTIDDFFHLFLVEIAKGHDI